MVLPQKLILYSFLGRDSIPTSQNLDDRGIGRGTDDTDSIVRLEQVVEMSDLTLQVLACLSVMFYQLGIIVFIVL